MRYQLIRTTERVELHDNLDPQIKPVYVDFVEGKARHRLKFGGGKGQGIAKAVGLHKLQHPHVIDATAGLGRESFVLASLGCRVTLLERNPMVHALLEDGLLRAETADDETLADIIKRMTLVHTHATDWLNGLSDNNLPDVIYLDPMFPDRQKSALVQKEMRFFHEVVGKDEDSAELLATARSKALHRIVVKRPNHAATLDEKKPAFIVPGKTVRFDVYLPIQDRSSRVS